MARYSNSRGLGIVRGDVGKVECSRCLSEAIGKST